jgi:hypothetical protein
MSDILTDYREWRAKQPTRISTHSDRCHLWHRDCLIHRLAAALEQARRTDACELHARESQRLQPDRTPEAHATMAEGTQQARCTLADIRNHLAVMNPGQRERRTAVLLREAAGEIEQLREAIRRLAEQDATLSVCDGSVIVEMDATLTDAERVAIAAAADDYLYHQDPGGRAQHIERTLRGLLERTSPSGNKTAENGD